LNVAADVVIARIVLASRVQIFVAVTHRAARIHGFRIALFPYFGAVRAEWFRWLGTAKSVIGYVVGAILSVGA